MSANNNAKALKSGAWYTAANFLMKSIGFITTPIFTRLLSHQDYGLYSNYASWLSTFTVLATMNLGASFISARFDFEDDFDGYISSTLVLSSLVTGVWAILINLFRDLVSAITNIEPQYLNIMVIYLLFYSAVDMFQTRERYYFKYKISVAASLIIAVSSAFLSVLLVVNLENKLFGRIIGSAVPTIFLGIVFYIVLLTRGKKIDLKYWKYALPICLPFIPHMLSLSLLNSMDKMMITEIRGAEENAMYSVAYQCGAVITLLITSLNRAFAPWLGEKLNEKDYQDIRKISKTYILFFVFASCGIMLLTPELLFIMGGRGYSEAVFVMPPVAFGCVCQFMYTMYVNVEQFSKKTIGMAFASVAAVLSNFVLNSIFIPKYGYIGAAYTTLASYAILLFLHMLLVKRLGMLTIYPTKVVFFVLIFMSCYTLFVNALFAHDPFRFCAIAVYAVFSIILAVKNKGTIRSILSRHQ